jgi:type II secretory pathway component GspD/PulD (secretin)
VVIVRDFHSVLEAVDAAVASIDGRPQQVLIEATLLSVSLEEGMELGVDFTALLGVDFSDVGATSPDGTSVVLGGFSGDQLDSGAGNATSSFNKAFAAGGLNFGYLKNGVAVFVHALQQTTDATVLANPRVVTLNKQRGEVLLGRRDGYLTTTVTQTSTTQSVEYLETGTRLIFRPFIMSDDLVRLEIHPEDSNGGISSEGLPFKETTEVTTNVVIRSGETVVIGGLFRNRKSTLTRKVPFLGDLWLIGQIFRSTDERMRREEIIVVLTPRIVDPLAATVLAVDPQGGPADRKPPPVAADVSVPGLAAGDAGRVAQAYLSVAATLVQRGDYGSAALLLAGLDAGQQQRTDVRDMRRTIYGLWAPARASDDVDRRIRQQVLEDAP